MEEKQKEMNKLSVWRLIAYFIIYSFIGYLIETIYAFVVYGVIESRQSFLYGPFCSIYGLGAVAMIYVLQYFGKNVHTLFVGGFLTGSVIEYIVSFLGEKILNTKWWDYSNKFLNLNGRICFRYSIFWGLLGLYLVKILNPRVDNIIDWAIEKFNRNKLKTITLVFMTLLSIDCVVSGVAIDLFLTRVAVDKNLEVSNKVEIQEKYDNIYNKNTKLSEFVYRHWGNEKMIKTYPNLTIQLSNGEFVHVKQYYPEIQSYYLKF